MSGTDSDFVEIPANPLVFVQARKETKVRAQTRNILENFSRELFGLRSKGDNSFVVDISAVFLRKIRKDSIK
jgi:hypothetical protein